MRSERDPDRVNEFYRLSIAECGHLLPSARVASLFIDLCRGMQRKELS